MTTKNIQNAIVNDYFVQRQIFRILFTSFVLLSLCYVYFIGSITFNVLARKSLETSSRELASQVGELEVKAFTLSNSIDKSFAQAHGFVDAKGTIFAYRDSLRVALR